MRRSIVCLDQNAWIELSRVHRGKNGQAVPSGLPAKLLALANRGSHLFPISIERLFETQKDSIVERRKRLARFMIDLSKGLTIGPAYRRTIPFECRNHLIEYHGLQRTKYNIRECLIGKGISGIFGAEGTLVPSTPGAEPISPELRETIIDYVNSDDVLYELISGENEGLRRKIIEDTKLIYDKAILKMEKNLSEVPSGMNKKERHDGALASFFNNSILPIMFEELLNMGIPLDGIPKKTRPDESPEQFLRRRVPSAYVSFELSHARDKQSGGRVKANDFDDISFLSYAIPYADIIVTERLWVQLAKRLNMDKFYGSTIIPVSEMNRLLEILP